MPRFERIDDETFIYSYNNVAGMINAEYVWTVTSPSDELLEVILKYDLSDILINRNEFSGFQIGGSGTHSGTGAALPPRRSSSRKYECPCCGMSVRATKIVNIACLDCDEPLLLVG